MHIYDISVAITPGATPVYPGDPGIEFVEWAALARGDAANVTFLRFGAHTATHVDAPAHFIAGAAQVLDMPLEVLLGPAHVVEVGADVHAIDAAHIAAHVPAGATRVLFKTRNSAFWAQASPQEFRTDFTYLTTDGARALVERRVQLVGIDYLSVERFQSDNFDTHTTLLARGVVIIEGLDLRAVPTGRYELICLPLKLAGTLGDGAPARAVLRTLDEEHNVR
jgi:arylformamidase